MKKSTVKFFKEVWGFLKGKKVYISIVLFAFIVLLRSQGWIEESTAENFKLFFGSIGLASMRSAIK